MIYIYHYISIYLYFFLSSFSQKQSRWCISWAILSVFCYCKVTRFCCRRTRTYQASCGRPVVAGPSPVAKPCALRHLSGAVGWNKPCHDGWDRRAWGHLGRWLASDGAQPCQSVWYVYKYVYIYINIIIHIYIYMCVCVCACVYTHT